MKTEIYEYLINNKRPIIIFLIGSSLILVLYILLYEILHSLLPRENYFVYSFGGLTTFLIVDYGFSFTKDIRVRRLYRVFFTSSSILLLIGAYIYLYLSHPTMNDILYDELTIQVCYDINNIGSSDSISSDLKLQLFEKEQDLINRNILNLKYKQKFVFQYGNCSDSLTYNQEVYPIIIRNTEIKFGTKDTCLIHQIELRSSDLTNFTACCIGNSDMIRDSLYLSELENVVLFTPQTIGLYLRAQRFVKDEQYLFAIFCYQEILNNISYSSKSILYLKNKKTHYFICYEKARAIDLYIDHNHSTNRENELLKREVLDDFTEILSDPNQEIFCDYAPYGIYIFNKFLNWPTINSLLAGNNTTNVKNRDLMCYKDFNRFFNRYYLLLTNKSICSTATDFKLNPNLIRLLRDKLPIN
jgi:hypothetical protein